MRYDPTGQRGRPRQYKAPASPGLNRRSVGRPKGGVFPGPDVLNLPPVLARPNPGGIFPMPGRASFGGGGFRPKGVMDVSSGSTTGPKGAMAEPDASSGSTTFGKIPPGVRDLPPVLARPMQESPGSGVKQFPRLPPIETPPSPMMDPPEPGGFGPMTKERPRLPPIEPMQAADAASGADYASQSLPGRPMETGGPSGSLFANAAGRGIRRPPLDGEGEPGGGYFY